MTDILSDDLRNDRVSRMLYSPALMKLGYIDFASLLAALPAWFGQMWSCWTLLPGQVHQQAQSLEGAR